MTLDSSDRQPPTAVVVGMDDLRGVYAARTLARHGVPVIGICQDPKSYGVRSRACQRIITAKGSDGLIEVLIELAPELDSKAIIVPCTDTSVVTLSSQRSQLERSYSLALPSAECVALLTDKVRFLTYASENHLPIPETRILYTRRDAEEAAAELRFPCVLKPPDSRSPRWLNKTHQKAIKIDDCGSLLSTYDRLSPYADALIAQRWIEGSDSNHYVCNCYLGRKSEPLVTFVLRKLRQWPPLTGDGSLNEEYRDDEVLNTTVRIFQELNYRGLGELEFKRDESSGRPLIIEPNIGRATGRFALAEGSGVELLYTMYCDLAGWPLPESREQHYRGIKWVFLRRDLMSAFCSWRRGEISLSEWYRSLRGRKVYALFSWTDPGPFLADLVRAARLLLTRHEREKRTPPHTTP